jgi:hypothetical protein
VYIPLKLFLRARARQYIPFLSNGVKQIGDGGFNIVIGGLGTAWVNLFVGLSPFFLIPPLTLVFVGVYLLLIVDVFFLKRTFRKTAGLSPNTPMTW